MNVLGVSFGRPMKNCEIMLKTALMAAEEYGATVKFMRLLMSDIKPCYGCGCKKENGRVICCIKDNLQDFEDAYLDADAIIFATPVYALGPTGIMKNLADRMGPGRDMASLINYQKQCAVTGGIPLDERYFKQRYCGLISVGGAKTQNWVSLGLAGMHINAFPVQMLVLDQIDAYDGCRRGHPLLDDKLISMLKKMGVHIAGSCGKPVEEVEYIGKPGICPVCHLNLITLNGTTTVECPVCGIEGKLSINGDKVSVDFSPEQQKRSRHRIAGLIEHQEEILTSLKTGFPKVDENQVMLDSIMKKYREYDKGHLINLRKIVE